ncbi:MAG: hypothetical protein R3F11_29645 [Verrucomicrobiales bacterium]
MNRLIPFFAALASALAAVGKASAQDAPMIYRTFAVPHLTADQFIDKGLHAFCPLVPAAAGEQVAPAESALLAEFSPGAPFYDLRPAAAAAQIDLPPDAAAIYSPAFSMIFAKAPAPQMELLRALWTWDRAWMHGEEALASRQIDVQSQWLDVADAQLSPQFVPQWLASLPADSVKSLDRQRLTMRSAQRAKVTAFTGIDAPVEIDGEILTGDHLSLASGFSAFELDPVIGWDGCIIDFNLAPWGRRKVGDKIEEWRFSFAATSYSDEEIITMVGGDFYAGEGGRWARALAVQPRIVTADGIDFAKRTRAEIAWRAQGGGDRDGGSAQRRADRRADFLFFADSMRRRHFDRWGERPRWFNKMASVPHFDAVFAGMAAFAYRIPAPDLEKEIDDAAREEGRRGVNDNFFEAPEKVPPPAGAARTEPFELTEPPPSIVHIPAVGAFAWHAEGQPPGESLKNDILEAERTSSVPTDFIFQCAVFPGEVAAPEGGTDLAKGALWFSQVQGRSGQRFRAEYWIGDDRRRPAPARSKF